MTSAVQDAGSLLAALGGTRNATPGASSAQSRVQEAQDRFMTLLVTQIQNQDPLNPLDNAQVTTQLAQLNTVAGINQLNETLQGLAASFAASQTLQAAALIGHGVMVPGSQLVLAGGQALFGVELAQPVDAIDISILDAAGRVVHRASAGPQNAGIIALTWDGAADAGGRAADGVYRFALSARAGGKATDAKPLAIGTVSSITTQGSAIKINLGSGATVPLAEVRQII